MNYQKIRPTKKDISLTLNFYNIISGRQNEHMNIAPDYEGYERAKKELRERAKSVEEYDREIKLIIQEYGV